MLGVVGFGCCTARVYPTAGDCGPAFLGGFVLGHALGVTTALEHTVHLRRFAECKGKWGSEWFFHSDHSPERAGKPVAPEGSSATVIVPGSESGFRIRPYRGPLVPGYFKLLTILGKVEHKIVEWMAFRTIRRDGFLR